MNISIGNKRNKIYLVMTGRIPGKPSTNGLMHCFLKTQGQLHHIYHVEFGMDMEVQFLYTLDITLLPLNLVAKKLDQLSGELEVKS